MGAVPVHDPLDSVSVWLTTAFPDNAGAPELAGAVPTDATTPVGDESACPVPAELLAVTFTLSVWPTSADCTVYVLPVAPPMLPQDAPFEAQRSHWYA